MSTSRSDLALADVRGLAPAGVDPHGSLPFADNASHVRAELAWVHQLLRSHLRAEPSGAAPRVDEFAGLYISREEIEDYLASGEGIAEGGDGRDDSLAEPPRTEVWRRRAALDRRVQLSADRGVELRFERIATAFALDLASRAALTCAVAADVDPRIARACAYLQNDATRKRPSLALLTHWITGRRADPVAVRRLFGPASPLMAGRLLEPAADTTPLPVREAVPAAGIVDYLLGVDALPSAIAGAAEVVDSPRGLGPETYYRHHAAIVADLVRTRSAAGSLPLTYLSGPAGAGRGLIAEAFASSLGRPLIRVHWVRLRSQIPAFDECCRLLTREAHVRRGVVLLQQVDDSLGELDGDRAKSGALQALVQALAGADVIATGSMPASDFRYRLGMRVRGFEVPYPTATERGEMWGQVLPASLLAELDGDLPALAEKFRFTPEQVEHALRMAEIAAPLGADGEPVISLADLHARCREEAQRGLHLHCQQIRPRFDWDDIVLPPDVQAQLREICQWVKHGPHVYDDWAFGAKHAAGRGVSVLFSGPSGTGKTMSAEVIASELQLDLFRVDLSRVVSKYIGETEKNLARIFEQSAVSNCILFFDEADALFGKRTEVKDAHDRYANIEVNYLLSQMDRYQGLIVIATNLKGNLDPAFIRRFSHVVEYPVPNERLRETLWCKSFPAGTPVGADVDFTFLAQRLDLSGANIKNIALTSAFLASADGTEIGMDHVIRAARREYQKLGRICSKSDFGQYYGLVREGDAP